MEDIKNWLEQYRRTVEAAFGERICFLGLQGSRARGEAGPDSDIDVVLVLDRLAPEDLAGISATVSGGELTLSYDDISLDAGTYSAAAVSPVAALPRLMEAAGRGFVTEHSRETVGERQCLRLCCDLEGQEDTVYATWFDEETLLPIRSEILDDGVLVFAVEWKQFTVDGGAGGQPPAEESGENTTNQ